ESVAHGVRRLARRTLQSAAESVERHARNTDTAIHDARRALKKARALLAVVDASGGGRIGKDRKRLRKVNRRLSKLRDAEAMVEVLDHLRERAPGAMAEHTFALLRRQLHADRAAAAADPGAGRTLERVGRALRKSARSAKRWKTGSDSF